MSVLNIYKMPSDTREKEKAIGGILTLAQGGWIGGGVVSGLMGFVITFTTIESFPFSVFLFLLGIGFFTPFAFVKVKELSLFEYLRRRIIKSRQNPILLNERKRGDKN